MPKAPTPGAAKKADARKNGARVLRMNVDGETLDLVLPLSMADQRAVRLATGMSLDSFLGANGISTMGIDSLGIIWWVALRQNGDHRTQLTAIDAKFEAIIDDCAGDLSDIGKRVDIEEITGDDDEGATSPEG